MSKMKKAKSIRPPMPIVTPNTSLRTQETDMQFELEICWCVQQMEISLNSGKLSQKVAEATITNLKILKGNTAPIIKKRQIMKASMGDYRSKMKEEEKRMALASKQIKFTSPSANAGKKSSFVKKSAILCSEKDFKFDFETPNDNNDVNSNDADTVKGIQKDEKSSQETLALNKLSGDKLNLTSGSGFKFNFHVDEVNDEIKLNELSIKN